MRSRFGSPSATIDGQQYTLHWGDQFLTIKNGDGKRLKVYNGRLAAAMGSQSLESILSNELRYKALR